MAFTKTPMQSSQETKLVPLMYEYETRSRDALKDTDAVNLLWEPVNSQATGESYFNALKRDGVRSLFTTPDGFSTLGLFFWDFGSGYIIQWTVQNIYVRRASDGVVQATQPYVSGSATLTIGGTEFLYQNGQRAFLVYDGSVMWIISQAFTFTSVSNPSTPNFPAVGCPTIVFLDGYVFIGSPDGTITNSNLNDPTGWSASNFTKADSYPDNLNAIARVGPYLVALGTQSIQYYYDAGNPTGTPLASMVGSTLTIGLVGGLAQQEGVLWFVGRSSEGFFRVYKLENFKATAVSDAVLNRWLINARTLNTQLATLIRGNLLSLNGHQIYCIADDHRVEGTPTMYMYDIDTAMWGRIDVLAGQVIVHAATGNVASAPLNFSRERTIFTALGVNLTTDVYVFDPDVYQDIGVNFTVSFRTPQQDFGTYREKFGNRLLVWADQASATSLCNISWTDDDYQTYSTPRTVDLSNKYPILSALGKFKRRAFKVEYADNFPMRWKMLELDYDQGTS